MICAIERLVPIDLLLVNDMAGVYPARRRDIRPSDIGTPFAFQVHTSPAGCPILGMSAIAITFVRVWPVGDLLHRPATGRGPFHPLPALRLLRHLERVVSVDAEEANRTFERDMTE
jgi:hypothetical protein